MPNLKSSLRSIDRWQVATGAALFMAIGCLVWVGCWVLVSHEVAWDDHYMSYIYSRNLVAGHGLRYNASDPAPTEGYSSLTHVVLVALGDRLGLDPLLTTRALSVLSFMLIPLLVGLPLARLAEVSALTALAVSYGGQLLYFLTTTTSMNLALGMETIIFMGSLAALGGWSIGELDSVRIFGPHAARRVVSGCITVALVALGRPEGPLLVLLTLGMVQVARRFLLRELPAGSPREGDRTFAAVAAFALLGLAAYFVWKKAYFGYLLPNPYYVKSHNAIMGMKSTGFPGWPFTRDFLAMIWPWAAAIPILAALAKIAGAPGASVQIVIAAALPGLLLVLAYAKAIHEAASWHRYEFPFLVYLHLALTGLVCLISRRVRLLPLALVTAAAIGVSLCATIRAIPQLNPFAQPLENVGRHGSDLIRIGKDLGRTGLGQRALILTSAAGAIPYFSGLRTIDLLGLNTNELSGRTPMTIEQMWSFIDDREPDIIMSGLPPATPGTTLFEDDPVYRAPSFDKFFDGVYGSELPKHWDPAKLPESLRREMLLLRDRYTFGAAYPWASGWQILYLRRDSPYRDFIRSTLWEYSFSMDRETNLQPYFMNDPRRL